MDLSMSSVSGCERDKVRRIAKHVLAVKSTSSSSPRLKKTLLLRSIESEILNDCPVSETMLECLEAIEVLDRGLGILVTDSMKAAYCAVATNLSVKFLALSSGGKYTEAVIRVWRGWVRTLMETEGCGLVFAALKERMEEVVLAMSDVACFPEAAQFEYPRRGSEIG